MHNVYAVNIVKIITQKVYNVNIIWYKYYDMLQKMRGFDMGEKLCHHGDLKKEISLLWSLIPIISVIYL
jgi:hypothetical protein